MFSFNLVDDAGEGPHRVVVMPEERGKDVPVMLYVRFKEPPGKGSRFTYHDRVWQLTEERLAKPDTVEGDRFWEARPVEQ